MIFIIVKYYGYIFFIALGIICLQIFYCSHCMNFACPLNRVDKITRKYFFENNPRVKKEWNK